MEGVLNSFIELVQGVGFPIASAVALFMLLRNESKSHREESQQMTQSMYDLKSSITEAMAEQRQSTTEAINNNTIVLQKLLDKLDGDK